MGEIDQLWVAASDRDVLATRGHGASGWERAAQAMVPARAGPAAARGRRRLAALRELVHERRLLADRH